MYLYHKQCLLVAVTDFGPWVKILKCVVVTVAMVMLKESEQYGINV